jgi:hypothetical protein
MGIDLAKFAQTLPYASELFGVYQPLLGWKSKRIIRRIAAGLTTSLDPTVRQMAAGMHPVFEIRPQADPREFTITRIHIATLANPNVAHVNANFDSFLGRALVDRINAEKLDLDSDRVWTDLVGKDALDKFLTAVAEDPAFHTQIVANINQTHATGAEAIAIRAAALDRESVVAGTLNHLFENGLFGQLRQIFKVTTPRLDLEAAHEMRRLVDPLETFDPRTEIDRVALSPVGIVHLFRQYFFEFDTFLGSPVQHIWLSPGSSLELVEISTRKTTIERTAETSFEAIQKSEKSDTEQDEISDAVRSENQSNTKFGASVSAGVSGGTTNPIYSATMHTDATVSYGTETTSKTAKEVAHKQMRTQSTKISSEIKKNFKTTFRTVSEVTDVSSKRYVLQNASPDLKNYELRRKMRQVGVQVQDIGSQLCWQTYVDLPGSHLGLANLVHIAEPPNYDNLHAPDPVLPPANIEKDLTVPLAFQGAGHDNDTNVHYVEDARWSEFGHPDNGDINDKIHINYLGYRVPIIPSFVLQDVQFVSVLENKQATPEFRVNKDNTFDVHLRSVNYDGDEIKVQVKLVYVPADDVLAGIAKTNASNAGKFDDEKKRLAQETLIKEARDRVKLASNVQPRGFEDLREEERIIVYRELISDLLNVAVLLDDPRVRHVLSELISSMFDVDSMLYFVAPDWWRPRKRSVNQQSLGSTALNPGGDPRRIFSSADVVTWSDGSANYRQNYYITEDSAPARLGSSIGWIMQLDGDNLRNAFLNAPWVKAVMPIRPGKELAALNWLSSAAVEGVDSLDTRYQSVDKDEETKIIEFLEAYPWPDGSEKARYTGFAGKVAGGGVFVSIRDALRYLALQINQKNIAQMQVQTETVDGVVRSYLPTEKVFEHGFDPLKDGFKAGGDVAFEVFDQWVEVLPTDQVVAVDVQYDPKTGRML